MKFLNTLITWFKNLFVDEITKSDPPKPIIIPPLPHTAGLDRIFPKGHSQAILKLQEYSDLNNIKVKYYAAFNASMHSSVKRLYICKPDFSDVESYCVAHGSGSDKNNDGYAESFSNVENSKKTSLGIYRCAEVYQGKHGKSMRLDGLEASNSKARSRAIVVHGADYVGENSAGRSWGCPAVSNKYSSHIIDYLKDGGLLIIFTSR